VRGHLLVGDELVKQQQWNAALPHFSTRARRSTPTSRASCRLQGAAVRDCAQALAAAVKAKKGGNDYAGALKSVNDALAPPMPE
jgi:hypothetical protein